MNSTLLREISWTNNLTIMSRAKSIAEKEFYHRLCIKQMYSSREQERQINSDVFEKVMILRGYDGNQELPSAVKEIHSEINMRC